MRKALIYIALLLSFPSLAQTKAVKTAIENFIVDAATTYSEGDAAGALKNFEFLASKDSTNDALHYYKSMCKYQLRRLPEAVADMEKAVRLDSSNLVYRHYLALMYLETGKSQQGGDILRELMEIAPSMYKNSDNLTTIADSELSMHRDSLAKQHYLEALEYDPDNLSAVMGLSEYYRMNGNFLSYFTTVSRMFNEPAVPVSYKTDYLNNLIKRIDGPFFRTWGAQIDSLVTATVHCAPADSAALRYAAGWFYSTARKDLGRKYYRTWFDTYSDDIETQMVEMELALIEDRPQEAIELCENILQRTDLPKEDKVDLFCILADTCHQLGEVSRSFSYYEKALKLDPHCSQALNNYAYFLSERGEKLAKAEKMSRIAVDLRPEDATYLDTYGWILFLRGKAKEAKPFFKKAMLYGGKDSKVILEHYSKVLEALNEKELADYYRYLAENAKDE